MRPIDPTQPRDPSQPIDPDELFESQSALPAADTTPGKLRPRSILISAWIVAIIASLLFADDVHRQVIKKARFQAGNSWLRLASQPLQLISQKLGVSAMGQKLQRLPNPLDTQAGKILAQQLARRRPATKRPQPRPQTRLTQKRPTHKRPQPRRPTARPPASSKGTLRAAHKIRRLLLVGASSMFAHPGTRIERRLKRHYPGITVQRLGKISSSLTRPDYFDWPKTLKVLVKSFKPDVVLANFGFNDIQAFPYKENGVTKYVDFINNVWRAKYLAILRPFLSTMETGGARIAWLSYARMPKPMHTRALFLIHQIYRREVQRRGGVFLSWWRLSEDPTGQKPILEQITYKGETGPTRIHDGIHFTILGAKYMAHAFCQQLERHFYIESNFKRLGFVRKYTWTPKKPKATAKPPQRRASKQAPRRKKAKRGRKTPPPRVRKSKKPRKPTTPQTLHMLVFAPRGLNAASKKPKGAKAATKRPTLLLYFKGKQARYAPIEAHELLQELAQSQQRVIVVPIDPTLDSGGEPQPVPRLSYIKTQLPALKNALQARAHIPTRWRRLTFRATPSTTNKAPLWDRWRTQLKSTLRRK